MTSESRSSKTTTRSTRRGFLQAIGAASLAAGGVAATSRTAAAASSRRRYRIMKGTEYETTVYVFDSGKRGPTTLVTGGIHGNEPSGYRAADRIKDWAVDCGKLVVIPRCNQPAISAGTRKCSQGDLNRKFPPRSGSCYTGVARAIWRVVLDHDPDQAFDLHSARGIYKSGDGSVGQAMFPTWTAPARRYGENAVAALNDEFGLAGEIAYRMGNTLDADRNMLMHRVAGVLDRPGYILETTRKGTTTAQQIDWHLFAVEHLLAQFGQRVAAEVPADAHEIHIRGTGPAVRYEFKATESVTNAGSQEWNDYVYSRGVNGIVSTGDDRFYFTGDLEYFTVKQGDAADLDVFVDGERLDLAPSRHEVVVRGTGPATRYEFKATEAVKPVDAPEWNDYVYPRGVNGTVSTGEDRFHFWGDLEYFEVKEGNASDLNVYVDGRGISAAPNTHVIDIEGTGPAVRYEFKATESVTNAGSQEWNDYVYSRGVNGMVSTGDDRFVFEGDLEYFTVKQGDAADLNVFVDGLPLDVV